MISMVCQSTPSTTCSLPITTRINAAACKPAIALVTHYHLDHCDGTEYLRRRHGTKLILHPRVASALKEVRTLQAPWLPRRPIHPNGLWPDEGLWQWKEYQFRVAPWPGQTWWHCLFMTDIAGQEVAFAGDTFQPPTRWNGTGGFCAYNRSSFSQGFIPSATRILEWQPDIVAAGHGTVCVFNPARFEKIMAWARRAEQAVTELCPTGDLDRDYYHWGTPWCEEQY